MHFERKGSLKVVPREFKAGFTRDNPVDLLGVGTGQLSLMMGESAAQHGLRFGVVGNPADCATQTANVVFQGKITDGSDLFYPVGNAQAVALDTEHVHAGMLQDMQRRPGYFSETKYPKPRLLFNPNALEITQDKKLQHKRLKTARLPFPDMAFAITDYASFARAVEKFGYQAVLQTGTMAYDGKGNEFINGPEDMEGAYAALADRGNLFLERKVPFAEELAIQILRDQRGGLHLSPLIHSVHDNGMLYFSYATRDENDPALSQAQRIAREVAYAVPSFGLTTVELMKLAPEVAREANMKPVLINEVCIGRPHNSGHLGMNGFVDSQFDQIVKLAMNKMPEPFRFRPDVEVAAMLNLIGTKDYGTAYEGIEEAEKQTGTFVWMYGKEGRDKRKLGHVNYAGTDLNQGKEALEEALRILNYYNDDVFRQRSLTK